MENEMVLKARMLPVWRTAKNALKYYQKRFKLISGILALPLTLYLVATIFHSFRITYFWGGPITLIGFIVTIFSILAVFEAMLDGSEQEILACYKKSWKKFFSFLWMVILTSAIVLGGFILGIIPGIILSVWLTTAVIIFFAENERGLKTLIKSRNYVRDYWWPVFGRIVFLNLLMAIFFFVFMGILGLLLGRNPSDFPHSIASEWASLFSWIVVFVFLFPFKVSFIYSLYLQLKKIKADDTSINVVSHRTKNWFVGFGIFGIAAPIVALMLISTFALGGIFGFLLQDINVNGIPARAWLYNRGLIENNSTLIDKTDTMMRNEGMMPIQ